MAKENKRMVAKMYAQGKSADNNNVNEKGDDKVADKKAQKKSAGIKGATKTIAKKPAANAGMEKKKKNETYEVLVTAALKELKNRKGVTLAAIRNHIGQKFELTKKGQTAIKKFLGAAFDEKRIIMVNDDDDEINYKKRFALAPKSVNDDE